MAKVDKIKEATLSRDLDKWIDKMPDRIKTRKMFIKILTERKRAQRSHIKINYAHNRNIK